jgi:excisionase family DNA binding protein
MRNLNLMSVADAAKRLGISDRRVRALAADGRLPAQKLANRWFVEVDRLSERGRSAGARGRPFSGGHSLGLLFLASGDEAPWLSAYEKWRLRRYALPRLQSLLPRLRTRANVHSVQAPESVVKRLANDAKFVRSGVSAAEHHQADIAARSVLDGYYSERGFEDLAYRYALQPAAEGAANLIVRGVEDPSFLSGRRFMPMAVVAVDLADSVDARTKRAGVQLLRSVRP